MDSARGAGCLKDDGGYRVSKGVRNFCEARSEEGRAGRDTGEPDVEVRCNVATCQEACEEEVLDRLVV